MAANLGYDPSYLLHRACRSKKKGQATPVLVTRPGPAAPDPTHTLSYPAQHVKLSNTFFPRYLSVLLTFLSIHEKIVRPGLPFSIRSTDIDGL
jgi:hypothetical protein